MSVKTGQVLELVYESRKFEVIVIDPNGLGKNQPTIGFGYNMMEKYGGLPQSTITDWRVTGDSKVEYVQVPSGGTYRVTGIKGQDGNQFSVIEVSDWVAIAAEAIKKSKVSKKTKDKLVDFLSWFAVKGFYTDAYLQIKENFTAADGRAVTAWLQARLSGIARRNNYTKFLQEKGCLEAYEYAAWTNRIYRGLFGKTKQQMVDEWELVEGSKEIGRNYIPEVEGIQAVAYCETQVVELFVDDLDQAHDDAINFARRKFFNGGLAHFNENK